MARIQLGLPPGHYIVHMTRVGPRCWAVNRDTLTDAEEVAVRDVLRRLDADLDVSRPGPRQQVEQDLDTGTWLLTISADQPPRWHRLTVQLLNSTDRRTLQDAADRLVTDYETGLGLSAKAVRSTAPKCRN